MDLKTLKELKQYAGFMSDLSTKTSLYKRICDEIGYINKLNANKTK